MRNEIHEQFKRELLRIFQFENLSYSLSIKKLLNFKRRQIKNILDKLKPIDLSENRSIYDLVINFFSRYVKNGIFFSKGIFSSIQFNEDDISLEWLNKDQEYVKLKDFPNNQGKFISEDYFIHKNLNSLLKSDLNQFIKDTILGSESLQELESEILQERIKKAKKIGEIAHPIIEVLTQIENFQLELWYKRNLVIDTNYVVTLDKIREYAGELFLERIIKQTVKNNGQLEEWLNLFSIDFNNKTTLENFEELMKSKWRYLPIDTKYFDEDFKWNLLHSLSQENSLPSIPIAFVMELVGISTGLVFFLVIPNTSLSNKSSIAFCSLEVPGVCLVSVPFSFT